MDRSNTRNMRGGKARFVQRNHTHLPKSPRLTYCKSAAKIDASRIAITSLRMIDAKKEGMS